MNQDRNEIAVKSAKFSATTESVRVPLARALVRPFAAWLDQELQSLDQRFTRLHTVESLRKSIKR